MSNQRHFIELPFKTDEIKKQIIGILTIYTDLADLLWFIISKIKESVVILAIYKNCL